ncbi:MAG: tetratricopeptide repeat protein [Armatimonadota bacterium]
MPRVFRLTVACVLGLALFMLPAFSAAPTVADKAFAKAKQLYDTGSDALAVTELQAFVTAYPTDPRIADASFMLGNLFQREHDTDKALAAYSRVIAKATQPEQTELRARTHFQMGDCYLSLKDYEKAQRSYGWSLQLAKPGSDLAVRTQYWQAECLYQLSRLDEALKQYRGVIDTSPTHVYAAWSYYSTGVIKLQQNEYTPAIEVLEKVRAQYKESEVIGEATLILGFAYSRRAASTGNVDAKKADYTKAAAMFAEVRSNAKATPTAKEQAVLSLAQIAFDQKEYAKAEAFYAGALETLPAGSDQALEARLCRGHALFNQGKYRDAAGEYDKVAHGKSVELAAQASYWLGNSWFKEATASKDVKAYQEAITAFQRFLTPPGDKRPQAARAALYLAFSQEDLSLGGDSDLRKKAVAAFNRVIAQWPMSAEAKEAKEGAARLTKTMSAEDLALLVTALPPGDVASSVEIRLAREQFLAGKYENAIASARKVLDSQSTDALKAQAAYLIGASRHKLGHLKEAVESYQSVLANAQRGELTPFAQRGLTQAYLEDKNYKLALPAAQALNALKLDAKEKAEALMFLAEASFNNRQHAEAMAAYATIVDDFPTSYLVPNALMGIAWIAEVSKKQDDAIKRYQDLIIKFPNDRLVGEAFFRLGVIFTEQKKYDQAIKHYQNVPGDHKLADQAAVGIAWAYWDQDKRAEAIAQFTTVADKFPASLLAADSMFRVGEYWLEQKKHKEAMAAYTRALKLATQPTLASLSAYKLGVCAFYEAQYAGAATAFGRVVTDYPTSDYAAESLFWKARSLEQVGGTQLEGARDAYVQFVTKYPTQALVLDAALGAGRTALGLKQYATARADLTKALDLCARETVNKELMERAKNVAPEAQFWMGQTYMDEKKYTEALKEFAQVSVYQYAVCEPWYSRSMLQTVRCNLQYGDKEAAQKALKRLLQLFPDSEAARAANTVARENNLDTK